VEQQLVEQTTSQTTADSSLDSKLDRLAGGEEQPQQQQTEETVQTQDGEQAAQDPSEAAAALEEVDFEGERYQLPPKLKAALMRQADYTQKTQAVSERERMVALQAQRQQIEAQFQQVAQPEITALHELEAAIKQYDNVNWQALDTDSLVKTRHALDMLKERRERVKEAVTAKRGEFEGKVREVNQSALREANAFLSRHVPKWGPEVQNGLMSYGQAEGYSDVELGSIRDPRLIRTLWKAQQYDALQAGKSIAAKRTNGVPPVVKPGATQGTSSHAQQTADTIKQLHQAKDPVRKKELLDKAIDLKLGRFLK
jgi:hypothetical protein